MIPVSKRRLEQLQDQVRRYRKYAKPLAWLTKYWFAIIAVSLFLSALGEIFIFDMPAGSENLMSAIVLSLSFLIPFLFIKLLEGKSRIYQLDSDEWLVYHSLSILDSLENYQKSKRTELKKEYRKKAIKTGYDLLTRIKENWKVGNFKIAKSALGSQTSQFRKNLEYRIIPSLEKDGNLEKVRSFFYNFAYLLERANPSIADLEVLNESASKMPSWEEEVKKKQRGRRAKFKEFFITHKTMRHVGVFTIIVSIGCFVYVAGLHLSLVSRDGAFVASIALIGVLAARYLDYLRKEKS